MDFIWLGALAALWVVVAELVVGLNRLDAPKAVDGRGQS